MDQSIDSNRDGCHDKKSLKISKGQSEAVNGRRKIKQHTGQKKKTKDKRKI